MSRVTIARSGSQFTWTVDDGEDPASMTTDVGTGYKAALLVALYIAKVCQVSADGHEVVGVTAFTDWFAERIAEEEASRQ